MYGTIHNPVSYVHLRSPFLFFFVFHVQKNLALLPKAVWYSLQRGKEGEVQQFRTICRHTCTTTLDLQTFKVNRIVLQPAGASQARAVTAPSVVHGPTYSCHFLSRVERASFFCITLIRMKQISVFYCLTRDTHVAGNKKSKSPLNIRQKYVKFHSGSKG